MTRVTALGKALLLLLAVLLVVPWNLAAAPRRTASPRVAAQAPAPAASLAVQFGSWLRSLWGKEGSNIDPDGRAVVRPAGVAPAGSNIDPNGLPGDIGADIDPNG